MKKENKGILIALKKAHSHLGNVISMVENNKYCIDILQQNLAVIGLLKSANGRILDGHLRGCFMSTVTGGGVKKKEKMIEEVIRINKTVN